MHGNPVLSLRIAAIVCPVDPGLVVCVSWTYVEIDLEMKRTTLQSSEKLIPAKTKKFLVHCFGRIDLMMARNMALAHAEVVPASLYDDADIHAWPKGTDVTIRTFLRADGTSRGVIAMASGKDVTGEQFRHGNLVSNALRHSRRQAGSVRLNVRAGVAGQIELHVQDDGEGIAPDLREQVFEPFFTTKEPGKGTGLGLAISARLVDSFGGKITVESEPGRGTTFRVRLPGVRDEE